MNEQMVALLGQLASGADPRLLLGQLVGDDPRLQPLLEQLSRPAAHVIDHEDIPAPPTDPDRRARGRARLEALLRDLEELTERNARLARALGACECFGIPGCDACGGHGRPGFYRIDDRLYDQLVRPAAVQRDQHRVPRAPNQERT
ncbi:MAG: hypothetical protein ABMA64_00820 [Myxococcota bacterium]